MNYFKTALLLAALTGFVLVAGYLLGGQSGLVIALVAALGMNLFAYWNSDKMVLRMSNAQEVGPNEAPELYGIVQGLAAARRPADAARLRDRRGPAQRLRHRPQSRARRRGRHHRPAAPSQPRGDRRRDGA